jgi:hypothetical protein
VIVVSAVPWARESGPNSRPLVAGHVAAAGWGVGTFVGVLVTPGARVGVGVGAYGLFWGEWLRRRGERRDELRDPSVVLSSPLRVEAAAITHPHPADRRLGARLARRLDRGLGGGFKKGVVC